MISSAIFFLLRKQEKEDKKFIKSKIEPKKVLDTETGCDYNTGL